MKTRQGFVSNSSSSSFVCRVCGNSEAYYDGLSEIDACRCQNDHTICNSHRLPDAEGTSHDTYEVPVTQCPICTLSAVDQANEAAFLRKVLGWSEQEVLTQIKVRCTDYKGFEAFVEKA